MISSVTMQPITMNNSIGDVVRTRAEGEIASIKQALEKNAVFALDLQEADAPSAPATPAPTVPETPVATTPTPAPVPTTASSIAIASPVTLSQPASVSVSSPTSPTTPASTSTPAAAPAAPSVSTVKTTSVPATQPTKISTPPAAAATATNKVATPLPAQVTVTNAQPATTAIHNPNQTLTYLTGSKYEGTKYTKYDDIITELSDEYDVDPNLVKKMIQAESDFNPNSKSSAGAMGLMQLMPDNVQEQGVANPYDPRQNIEGGIKELKGYITRYKGDLVLSLAAYNAGAGNVKKYGGVPPFKETQNYIKKILGIDVTKQ